MCNVTVEDLQDIYQTAHFIFLYSFREIDCFKSKANTICHLDYAFVPRREPTYN